LAIQIDQAPRAPADRALGSIVSVRPRTATKELVTADGGVLLVPRFAVAGEGEVIEADGRGTFIATRNGKARLTPAYCRAGRLSLGGQPCRLQVKEMDQENELTSYLHLSDLHYRGERGFGRKAVLVAVADDPSLPAVLGFVEVTTGFLMNSPRTRLLDSPYREGRVGWKGWGADEMSSLTSLIARVSRVVVHPELRGQGVGALLLDHAKKYARSHFHAGGLRPLFLEMTADMAKFVPFAEASGMTFIGYTEGNLHRVAKDMRYLLSHRLLLEMPTESLKARGIMQAQRRYASRMDRLPAGRSLDEMTAAAALDAGLDAGTYADFHGMIRLPKPTYLAGLTRPASRWVGQRVAKLSVPDQVRYSPPGASLMNGRIEIEHLSVAFDSAVKRTERTTAIQEAFGIKPEAFRSKVISDLSFAIEPGQICLVFGPSGSGKSTLLNILAGVALPTSAVVTGEIRIPEQGTIGKFVDLDDDQPLVEALAVGQTVGGAIHALNRAGLSDAKLYLRRYSELSNGQKYRAMLASLIASETNVWIADEFLAILDPTTARIVAANVAEHVRSLGVTLIVGAPHFRYFLRALTPDLVVELRSGWESRVLSGEEFAERHRLRANAKV
jgi:ABC-type lipoprotein export system ATPase subunit/GNAT superfamily N-acetyltransferase